MANQRKVGQTGLPGPPTGYYIALLQEKVILLTQSVFLHTLCKEINVNLMGESTIFSAKKLELTRKNAVKKFVTVFTRRVALTAIPCQCQKCECTADNDGMSYMECFPCQYPTPGFYNFIHFSGTEVSPIKQYGHICNILLAGKWVTMNLSLAFVTSYGRRYDMVDDFCTSSKDSAKGTTKGSEENDMGDGDNYDDLVMELTSSLYSLSALWATDAGIKFDVTRMPIAEVICCTASSWLNPILALLATSTFSSHLTQQNFIGNVEEPVTAIEVSRRLGLSLNK
uniref:Uncharacterized protein n=1 Tax=Timema monikensis TaxID=170555 RepID=A0A7R9HTS1_9NEOP|nr:unnamed protein product [Timema monikensis]